ncbi:MAG: response regulator [bacterium]|nr:response regulator [bacterium]
MATILLVEDSDELRKILQRILEEAGHWIIAVTPTDDDFIAASMTALQEHPSIDVLLTDINLKRQLGFELIKKIIGGQGPKPKKIVIMSADPRALNLQGEYGIYADNLTSFISDTFLKGDPGQDIEKKIAAVVAQKE